MYSFWRSLLFCLDPEQAHNLTLSIMRLVGALPPLGRVLSAWWAVQQSPRQVFGLMFPNPIGLAAGYDKDGLAWRGLACLGFGHIEIGTVTPRPQPGNPRPRLFRLPQDQALINRMGFPGRGCAFVARRLRGPKPAGLVLGVNLGVNKDTPLDEAAQDYILLMDIFAPLTDYLAVNVSSPNTVGLRRLQARDALDNLLTQLAGKRQEQVKSCGRRVPLLVKLAPDLTSQELDDALEVILSSGMDGVIATNTTISREGASSSLAKQAGGMSGAPLKDRSTQIVRQIYWRTAGKLPIVGVGGVMDANDARAKLDAGASLVQIYTGLVYAGPGLVRQIGLGLRESP
jgi:dihydroorotate dehydrogenase